MPIGITPDYPTIEDIQAALEESLEAHAMSEAEAEAAILAGITAAAMSPEDAKAVVVEAIEDTDARLPEDPPDAYGGTGLDATATQAAAAAALTAFGAAKPADVASALTTYAAAKPADVATALNTYAAAKPADVASALSAANVGIKANGINSAAFASGSAVPLPTTPPAGYGGDGLTTGQAAALDFLAGSQVFGTVQAGSNTTTIAIILDDGVVYASAALNPITEGSYSLNCFGASTTSKNNRGITRKIAGNTTAGSTITLTFTRPWPATPQSGDRVALYGMYR